jgi:hypothetical protein
VPAPPDSAAAPAEKEKEKEKPPLEITTGNKRECVIPGKHGDALAEGGKIDVSNPEPNQLKVLMTGVTAAHCFFGCHSVGIQTFQLEQEFEIASTDSKITQAVLTLQSNLNGYIRSRNKGSATMRCANATISPAGSGSGPLSVSFAPASVCGPCGQHEFKEEYAPPAGPPLPLGRYVLVASFVIEAQADGLINARGVADFSADDLPDIWKQEKDPFKDADRKEYGFSITLTAEPPKDAAKPATALRIRTVAPKVRQVSFETPAVISTHTVPPGQRQGLSGRVSPR